MTTQAKPSIQDASTVQSAQRIGNADEATLFARLCATGIMVNGPDREMSIALIGLAIRLNPSLLLLRFIDALPKPGTHLSELELCNTLARLGFSYSEISLPVRALDKRLGPAVNIEGPPQVIKFTGDDAVEVFDCTSTTTELMKADDPRLQRRTRRFVFHKTEDGGRLDRPPQERREGQSWFMNLLARMKGTLVMLMLISTLLTITAMTVPLFILLIHDQVVSNKSSDPLIFIAAGAVAVILAEIQLRYLRALALGWLTARLDFLVGTGLFDKLLMLPPRVAEKVPISSHIARIRTFESVRDFFAGPILVSALGLPATLFAMLIIWLIAGPLVLVSIGAVLTYITVAPLMWRKVSIAIEAAALEGSATQSFTLETFQKLASIRQDGLAPKWLDKYRTLSGSSTAAQYRLHMLGQNCEAIGRLISGATVIVTLWVGAGMVWAETLNIGGMIAVTMLTWSAVFPFHSLVSLLPRFEQSRKSIMQINNFMDSDLDESGEEGDVPAPVLKGEIEFAGVAVRYSQAAGPIFAGLNLTVSPGQLIAVSGPNGAGKSTILKLAAGLQPPMIGAVRLDGLDARQLNPRDLRRRIAYVPQRVAIFRGTIADNLRHANKLADDDELYAALDLVGGLEQVEALPNRLETSLNPAELGQSALLVQRIALARGILQNTQLILIDERPQSAMRAGLDRNLKALLSRLHGQRTVFLVSHRADFLRLADKAVVLRTGQVPVTGSTDKIMEFLT